MCHWNIQRLTDGKLEELRNILAKTETDLDILIITKNFCSRNVPDSFYGIPGYNINRKNRIGKAGGGILAYVKNSLLAKRRDDLEVTALLLGPWRSRTSFPVDFRFSSSHIEVLGSRLSNEGGEDWGLLLKKLEKVFQSWAHRKLSFRGPALITNSLGLSTFWYLGSIRLIPTKIIHEINKLVFPFVWGKKREWLGRSSVTQPWT